MSVDIFFFRCAGCGAERTVGLGGWQREGHPACCGERMLRPGMSDEVLVAMMSELDADLEALKP